MFVGADNPLSLCLRYTEVAIIGLTITLLSIWKWDALFEILILCLSILIGLCLSQDDVISELDERDFMLLNVDNPLSPHLTTYTL